MTPELRTRLETMAKMPIDPNSVSSAERLRNADLLTEVARDASAVRVALDELDRLVRRVKELESAANSVLGDFGDEYRGRLAPLAKAMGES
jgi:hypothetical protein